MPPSSRTSDIDCGRSSGRCRPGSVVERSRTQRRSATGSVASSRSVARRWIGCGRRARRRERCCRGSDQVPSNREAEQRPRTGAKRSGTDPADRVGSPTARWHYTGCRHRRTESPDGLRRHSHFQSTPKVSSVSLMSRGGKLWRCFACVERVSCLSLSPCSSSVAVGVEARPYRRDISRRNQSDGRMCRDRAT